ncbi:hypothetical protein [Albidovulum sp.]|jgi:hypothetical protein|uniref:hypothetical protein n=1 Tax=Albidovulum sp. TaxID=1872424 RepID=UPI0025C3EEA4|nr:hypothetical protein [Defluviimonas sp.]
MRVAAIVGLCLLVAGCSQPRGHAALRLTPDGVRVTPSISTSIAGIGVSVSQ